MADGGEVIVDLAVLRQQPGLFGLVAWIRPRGGSSTRSIPRRWPGCGRLAPPRGNEIRLTFRHLR